MGVILQCVLVFHTSKRSIRVRERTWQLRISFGRRLEQKMLSIMLGPFSEPFLGNVPGAAPSCLCIWSCIGACRACRELSGWILCRFYWHLGRLARVYFSSFSLFSWVLLFLKGSAGSSWLFILLVLGRQLSPPPLLLLHCLNRTRRLLQNQCCKDRGVCRRHWVNHSRNSCSLGKVACTWGFWQIIGAIHMSNADLRWFRRSSCTASRVHCSVQGAVYVS